MSNAMCERSGKLAPNGALRKGVRHRYPFQDYVWSRHLFFVTKNKKKEK